MITRWGQSKSHSTLAEWQTICLFYAAIPNFSICKTCAVSPTKDLTKIGELSTIPHLVLMFVFIWILQTVFKSCSYLQRFRWHPQGSQQYQSASEPLFCLSHHSLLFHLHELEMINHTSVRFSAHRKPHTKSKGNNKETIISKISLNLWQKFLEETQD